MDALLKPALERKLVRLLYWREKSLLEGTPEALRRTRKVDALLGKTLRGRRRHGWLPQKLFMIMTRACQLRCRYCPMSKSGRHMPSAVMRRGIEVLMAGGRQDLQLHFFGGEPLLRFRQMQEAVELAENLKAKTGKALRYLVTTNGLLLKDRVLDFFLRFDFAVVVSVDGGPEVFGLQRPGIGGQNFYKRVQKGLEKLRDRAVSYHVTIVVSPQSVLHLEENVLHLAAMGHKRIEITYEVGCQWSGPALSRLLEAVGFLTHRASQTGNFEIINATELRWEPVVLKSEMALDVDGGLYRHIGIYLEQLKMKREDFFVASVDSLGSLDGCSFSPFDDFLILARAYSRRNEALRRAVVNNIEVGWAMERFLQTR